MRRPLLSQDACQGLRDELILFKPGRVTEAVVIGITNSPDNHRNEKCRDPTAKLYKVRVRVTLAATIRRRPASGLAACG